MHTRKPKQLFLVVFYHFCAPVKSDTSLEGHALQCILYIFFSSLEAARYVECFKALVNKPPEELQSEAATASVQKDHLTLATDFLTSLRVVSRTDAATLLSRFGVSITSLFFLLKYIFCNHFYCKFFFYFCQLLDQILHSLLIFTPGSLFI